MATSWWPFWRKRPLSSAFSSKQTVFAFNNFNAGGKCDLGIGNNPDAKGHPDWTFSKTGSQYKAAEIYVVGLFDKTVAK